MIDPAAPFFWTLSRNRNFICFWNQFIEATVFASDGGYKFVVSLEGAPEGSAVFSDVFDSESAAAEGAEISMIGLAETAIARRAARPQWEDTDDGGEIIEIGSLSAYVAPKGAGYHFMAMDMVAKKLIGQGSGLQTIDAAKAAAMKILLDAGS